MWKRGDEKAVDDSNFLDNDKLVSQLTLDHLGCNPMHTHLGVSPVDHNETFF